MEPRFSAPVQTDPGDHPASYTMVTGSFLGVKRPGRGFDHQPHLVPKLKKEYSYTSTHFWAFVACYRMNFTCTFICTYVRVFLRACVRACVRQHKLIHNPLITPSWNMHQYKTQTEFHNRLHTIFMKQKKSKQLETPMDNCIKFSINYLESFV
jgi:hypothetical protein